MKLILTLNIILNFSFLNIEHNRNELIIFEHNNKLDKSLPSDYFKSLQTKKIVPGYGIGLLKIEETRFKDLFDEKYTKEFYYNNGIDLQFRNSDTLTGIVLENDGNFYINSSNKIGTTESEIIKSIGMLEHKNTEIKKGNKTVGAMQSLNYQGFSIIFIDTNKSDISIFKIKA